MCLLHVAKIEQECTHSEPWSTVCCVGAGEHLGESFPVLQQVFLAGLRDSSAEVRRTALQAAGAMVPWLEDQPHVNLMKDLVPLTIQVQPLFKQGSKSRPCAAAAAAAPVVACIHLAWVVVSCLQPLCPSFGKRSWPCRAHEGCGSLTIQVCSPQVCLLLLLLLLLRQLL